jgi:spore maturation protein CgeB
MESSRFKVLALSEIDLKLSHGLTPMLWQLFMRVAEVGTEIIIVPPAGDVVASPWWRYYNNPVPNISFHNLAMGFFEQFGHLRRPKSQVVSGGSRKQNIRVSSFKARARAELRGYGLGYISDSYRRYWIKHLERIWKLENTIDFVIVFTDNLCYMNWLPKYVHKYHGVPVVAYNADLPTYLWSERSWDTSPFYGVDLSNYDGFIVNSEGVADKLRRIGATNVNVLHFGADPDLFCPVSVEKDIDVSFYGFGSDYREKAMNSMISEPSRQLPDVRFRTAGKFGMDLGRSKNVGKLTFASMREFCCRSKINLNITRRTFAETYCSSTSRPFELAAMRSCIVSNPVSGMDKWFEPGKEYLEVHNGKEATDVYRWLLSNEDHRLKIAENARKKLLEKHTYEHRAAEFIEIVKKTCNRKS